MKKRTFLFAAFAAMLNLLAANAQNQEETIHLKNGSTIKGVVTEIKPSESMTIRSSNGSTFVIKNEDIERYERTAGEKTLASAEDLSPREQKRALKEDKERQKRERDEYNRNLQFVNEGYRGFFNGEFLAGNLMQMGVTTTHGYQVNKRVFVGAGVGMLISEDNDRRFPLFGTVHVETKTGKTSPFFEGRGGYELSTEDINGAYGSIGGGWRIKNFNIGVGMDMYSYTEHESKWVYDDDGPQFADEKANGISFNLKVGFDF